MVFVIFPSVSIAIDESSCFTFLSCKIHFALYIKSGVPFSPHTHGEQERNLRGGTENTIGIIGFCKAAQIVRKSFLSNKEKLLQLKKRLKQGIQTMIPNVRFNGPESNSLIQTLNISFPGALGETIVYYLDKEGIAVSSGSACSSGFSSHVLASIGLSSDLAVCSIRLSLGIFNTQAHFQA